MKNILQFYDDPINSRFTSWLWNQAPIFKGSLYQMEWHLIRFLSIFHFRYPSLMSPWCKSLMIGESLWGSSIFANCNQHSVLSWRWNMFTSTHPHTMKRQTVTIFQFLLNVEYASNCYAQFIRNLMATYGGILKINLEPTHFPWAQISTRSQYGNIVQTCTVILYIWE